MNNRMGDTEHEPDCEMNNASCIYAEFFGLRTDPFGSTPDPDFFFPSTSHATALEWITYAVEQHEFALVVGEVGSGKTVISRCLVDSLSEKHYRIGWIINPQLSPVGVLKEIYRQLFNEKSRYFKRDVLHQLQEGLSGLLMQGIFPVVIIDEAQTIPNKAVFEELRLLSNFQTDKQNLLSVVILGQPELLRRLKHRSYRSLIQRIRFTVSLNPLTLDEMSGYLNQRLKIAGYSGTDIFQEDSINRMYKLTEGYPRPVNHLATFTMMQAMSDESKIVTGEMVNNAAKNILYLPT